MVAGGKRRATSGNACDPLGIVLVLAVFFTTAEVFAQDPEILTQLASEQIYAGESVRYQVFLNYAEQPVEPELSGFDAFEVRRFGASRIDSVRTGIVDGRRSRIVRRGIAYEYVLTPKRSGRVVVPAPTAMVNGQQLSGKALTLTVVTAKEQDVVQLALTASDKAVFPTQPFSVSLKIWIQPVPEPENDRDPLSVQNPLAQLKLPWLDDKSIAIGIKPKVPGERWLGSMRTQRGGFVISGRKSRRPSSRSLFGGFYDDLPAGFRPRPKRVLRATASGRRIEYWEYTLTRRFTAEQVGEYSFGPASVKGTFAVRVDTRGQLEGEPIYAFAEPVTIRVKDVPTTGRPDSYSGAIGRFEIGADVAPRKAKVDDPLTLTVWIRGQGTLDNVKAPQLDTIADFADQFKIYEATEETQDDGRRFTYSVRPKRIDTTEVPPISIAYFDVDQESFVTLQTEPLAIEVTQANRLEDDEIEIAVPTQTEATNIESRAEGIFANVTDLRQLRDATVHPDRWFLGLGGLTALFFLVAVVTRRVQHTQTDPSLQRRRAAAGEAKRRLQSATRDLESGNLRSGAEGISEAIVGLVAAATDAAHGVLTTANAISKLREIGIAEDVVAQVNGVMQSCDHARYGAADESIAELPTTAVRVLDELVRAMKGRRLLS